MPCSILQNLKFKNPENGFVIQVFYIFNHIFNNWRVFYMFGTIFANKERKKQEKDLYERSSSLRPDE
jgi:hypothetical protein